MYDSAMRKKEFKMADVCSYSWTVRLAPGVSLDLAPEKLAAIREFGDSRGINFKAKVPPTDTLTVALHFPEHQVVFYRVPQPLRPPKLARDKKGKADKPKTVAK